MDIMAYQLPIAKKTLKGNETNVLNLQTILTKGLVKKQPPNWFNHFKSHIKRDRILPEDFKKQSEIEVPMTIGMKLLHYGDENNFIIRPAQRMQIETFFKNEKMKKLYCYLKGIKSALKVNVSSYFIKKVLMLEKFQKEMNKYDKFHNDMIRKALTDTVLKRYFDSKINFEKWHTHYKNFIPLKKNWQQADN